MALKQHVWLGRGRGTDSDGQGYIANRNRTLQHMYDNNIKNNIFLAGDSHQNWVRRLANFHMGFFVVVSLTPRPSL